MEAIGAALPEFDLAGDDANSCPERGAGNGARGIFKQEFSHVLEQNRAA